MESVLEIKPPDQAVPIDIAGESNKNWITGQIVPQPTPDSTHHRTPTNIAEAILADESRLENTTKILMEAQDISKLFSNHMIVETASEGGFNPNTGISSFGWVVAVNKTLIAMGRGPVAAHPELAESFRAEGYGLAAALIFLSSLTKHLKIDKQKYSWKFYIDNKAMIQRMHSYQWKEKITKWNLRPDADITNLADDYLQHFPASLIHVKSHQDKQRDTNDLPFEAQLNVIADAQATLLTI
jgi:ribonuclease HI